MQICDGGCGNGRYGDLHCNWRGLGKTCRFCFHDLFAAHLADEVAITFGGRVVMCDTYEPPPEMETTKQITPSNSTLYAEGPTGTTRSLVLYSGTGSVNQEINDVDPSLTEFSPNITMGQLCIFIPGHPELHHVTEVSILSIIFFMPGTRVVVATHPENFDSYNR